MTKRDKPIQMTFSPAGPGLVMVKVKAGDVLHADNTVTRSPVITFVKVMRDTTYNHTLIAKHKQTDMSGNGTMPKGLIYDYDVMIDGVKRGYFSRVVYGKGYELMNLVGDHWRYLINAREMAEKKAHGQKNPDRWSSTRRSTEAQSIFAADVLRALQEGHLLTVAEAAEEMAKRTRAETLKRKKDYTKAREDAIRDQGVKLYSALVNIQKIITDVPRRTATNRDDRAVLDIGDMVARALSRIKFPNEADFDL